MSDIEQPGTAPLSRDRAVPEEAERFVEQAEFGARRLSGIPLYFAGGLALAFSGFQLYTAAFGTLPGVLQRAVHLAFALGLCFLFYPASKKAPRASPPWSDYLLAGCAAWVALYVVVHYRALVTRVGDPTPLDIATGAAAILFILEASRRAVGIFLPAIACAFVLYTFIGPYLPDLLAHRGYTLRRVVDHLYFTTEGVFGIPLWVSSTFVFGFVLFGAVLERTGAGEYLIQLAFSLFGHTRGGPAKAAVVASAFMGTVSGSSIANAATVGSMTIPLMKRVGFRAEVAGGIETAAGGNGQIMPPVMGAAAFVMAEWLGIPYLEVARAAVLPAVIDQLALLGAVHLLALKHGITGLPRSELPRFWSTFLRGLHYFFPVVVLLYYLIWRRATPLTAAFMGTMAGLGIFVAAGLLRSLRAARAGSGAGAELADTGQRLVAGLFLGARTMAGVGATCACAGIIVGVVTLTGLGLNMADILLRLSGGYLVPSLFLTMLACLILGMGVPTTATYIIMATITAPALQAVAPGIPIIAIHLFVFYFGILADDTPPVGLAAYAAAGIAGSDPVRTGWQAFKLDMRTFLLPFMFVTAPQMLLINTTVLEAAWIFITASVGMYALAAGMQGYFLIPARLTERAVLCASAVGLVWAGWVTDVLGLIGVAAVVVLQRRRQRAREA
jgi:TRAP transporter 4TM/12TM fusion protein